MIHSRADKPTRDSITIVPKAMNPRARPEGSTSQNATVLLPAGASTSLFVKKPSVLSVAVRGLKDYKEQLDEFKRQRPEKHYQYLLNELRQKAPDPKKVKQEFRKLCACSKQSTISYAPPVPDSPQGRQAAVDDCLALREGIDKVLDYLPPGSHIASYLQHLKVQLGNQVVRIAEVADRAARTMKTSARMLKDLQQEKGQAAKMSDQGTEGAVFLGTKLRRSTLALAPARTTPRKLDAGGAEDITSESVVEELSSVSEELEAPAVPTSPRDDGNRPAQGFVSAQPKRKEIEYRTVFKSVDDPRAAAGAMQVHDRVAHVQRRAGQGLPFEVACHVLVKPDAELRWHLSQQLLRTETHKDRQGHLDRQRAALQEQPVLLQEFVPGTPVSELPLEKRKAMVSDPDRCHEIGATLSLCPVFGLNDHLAPDGGGYNNWTNVMSSPDGQRLTMIDLTPQNKDIAEDAKTSLKRLVDDLKQLARHVGPDGTLPNDWFTDMEGSIGDFWRVTYTAEGGLFSIEDFKSPEEQEKEQALKEALAALPADASVMERNFLKAQIKAIDETANQRARKALRPLRQQAAPAILAGLVDGLKWLERNAPTLLEAHAAAASDKGAQPALNAKDIQEISDILANLKPSERRKLSSLKPPLPAEASLLKA